MRRFLRTLPWTIAATLLAAPVAHAQLLGNLESTGQAGYGVSQPKSVGATVGSIINTFLGILGILAVALIVYAGFLWMTARGNEKQVEKARDILTQAIIGLVIILTAYAIAKFVVGSLLAATTTTDGYGF